MSIQHIQKWRWPERGHVLKLVAVYKLCLGCLKIKLKIRRYSLVYVANFDVAPTRSPFTDGQLGRLSDLLLRRAQWRHKLLQLLICQQSVVRKNPDQTSCKILLHTLSPAKVWGESKFILPQLWERNKRTSRKQDHQPSSITWNMIRQDHDKESKAGELS
jgi:hypothetical protein